VSIPHVVGAVTAAHATWLEAERPGLVDGLYLGGSVALGDYRPGWSDVDFVAVVSRPLQPEDVRFLNGVHAELDARFAPHYDGVYVERSALADPPVSEEEAPHALGGAFRESQACPALNPVTWIELRDHGVAIRGPAPAELVPPLDPGFVRAWLLENLQTYWLGIAVLREAAVAGSDDREPFETGPMLWGTLGPPRLHHTLASGSIVSKTEAGRYVGAAFPAWADLGERCVRARSGERVEFTAGDARASAALIRHVVADAVERWSGAKALE
jgi:Nucleotidyltransferase domain